MQTPTMVNNQDQENSSQPFVLQPTKQMAPVLGKITISGFGVNHNFDIVKDKVSIGRNSTQGRVDLHINLSSYISRKHIEISYLNNIFSLICFGKNGIFVDGSFQKCNAPPLELRERCVIRFPSTCIKLIFEPANPAVILPPPSNNNLNRIPMMRSSISQSAYDDEEDEDKDLHIDLNRGPGNMRPPIPYNNVNVPKRYMSLPPSPTGTISAVNSCPGSPRSSITHSVHSDVSRDLEQAVSTIAAKCQNFEEGLRSDVYGSAMKPPYSYAQLIVQAITTAPNQQLTLSGIYAHITKQYPFYRAVDKGWQNSIRHNLSLNRYFVKVPRAQEESGKGSFWRIHPDSEQKLTDTAWKKRRTQQRSSAANNARSAPASPERPGKTSPLGNIAEGVEPSTSATGGVAANRVMHRQTSSNHPMMRDVSHLASDRYAQSAPGSPIGGNPRHSGGFNVPELKSYQHPMNQNRPSTGHQNLAMLAELTAGNDPRHQATVPIKKQTIHEVKVPFGSQLPRTMSTPGSPSTSSIPAVTAVATARVQTTYPSSGTSSAAVFASSHISPINLASAQQHHPAQQHHSVPSTPQATHVQHHDVPGQQVQQTHATQQVQQPVSVVPAQQTQTVVVTQHHPSAVPTQQVHQPASTVPSQQAQHHPSAQHTQQTHTIIASQQVQQPVSTGPAQQTHAVVSTQQPVSAGQPQQQTHTIVVTQQVQHQYSATQQAQQTVSAVPTQQTHTIIASPQQIQHPSTDVSAQQAQQQPVTVISAPQTAFLVPAGTFHQADKQSVFVSTANAGQKRPYPVEQTEQQQEQSGGPAKRQNNGDESSSSL